MASSQTESAYNTRDFVPSIGRLERCRLESVNEGDDSIDDIVYVADRINNRIQAFRTDGTLLKERFIATQSLGNGAAYDVALSAARQTRPKVPV